MRERKNFLLLLLFENYIVLEHDGVYTIESNLPEAKRYRNNSVQASGDALSLHLE